MNASPPLLLTPPTPAMTGLLDRYGELLRRALPLKAAHFRELPRAAADLSRLLTEERRDMNRSYWSGPRALGAYAWYFLPWNLYRLCWVLPNLDLPLKDNDLVLDLGSGPLTLPQALWIARPDLRALKLTFVCSDTASQPLELGRTLFAALAASEYPDPASVPWKIRIARAGLEQALKEAGRRPGRPDRSPGRSNDKDATQPRGAALILAGNILNELKPPRSVPMDLHARGLAWRMARALAPGARAFFAEPGNRLGGKILSLLRKNALDLGLDALAPCTHREACPMLEPRRASWCHFSLDARLAPDWLKELSELAGLAKDRASLSGLLLRRPSDLVRLMPEAEFLETGLEDASDEEDGAESLAPRQFAKRDAEAGRGPARGMSMPMRDASTPARDMPTPKRDASKAMRDSTGTVRARVLSDAFKVPDLKGRCRYACSERGLILLENAERPVEGGLVATRAATPARRDPKTGALVFVLKQE